VGFASGIAVGGGFIAFLTVLGIIPRLVQLSKAKKKLNVFAASVVFGTFFGTYLSFTSLTWHFPVYILIPWGLFHGIFIGMLAAALTEVLNVFPIIFKRINMEHHFLLLIMAIVFGKVVGSLFQWLFFVKN